MTGVVLPYVVFETAYTLFYRWAQDDPGYPLSLLDPWYVMWFLVALFIWRLTTPLWLMLRHPLPVALGLAMLAAVSPDLGGDVSIQRVLGFLPFFVLGLTLRPEHFERLRTRRVRLCLFPVGLGALVVAYGVAPWFDMRLVLPPGQRHRPGRVPLGGGADHARPVLSGGAADGLLPGLGAAAGSCGSRLSARARCTAICCTAS